MATVYRAYDQQHNRLVALKVILPHLRHNREFVERFQREGRNAATLRHPHIVPIYESGVAEGSPYLVMAYVEGGSLADRLHWQQGPLPLHRTAELLSQIAAALDHAHQHGVIHRDVKPSNILLADDNKALLSDFGIAKAAWDSRLTESGDLLGSPPYMAPEQAQGKSVDQRTDIYALGVLLYELTTGRPPFQGNATAVLYQHVHETPRAPHQLNPSLPPKAERVILKALEKNPQRRYKTAGGLAYAFRNTLKSATPNRLSPEQPATQSRTSSKPSTTSAPPLRRNMLPIGIATAAGVLLIGGIVFAARRPNRAAPSPQATLTPTPTTSAATTAASPTPTPDTSTPQAPLQLIGPEDGSVFYPYQDVTLSWQGITLKPDQRFYVELRNSKTGQRVPRQLVTEDTEYTLPSLDIAGYRWRVRMEEDVEGQWKIIDQPSAWRSFRIVAPPTETPTPTPKPTDTPVPPTVASQAQPPQLQTPPQGSERQNPITFQWSGTLTAGQAYQVTAYHAASGQTIQSALLTVTEWSMNLPAEQHGDWRWSVSVVEDNRTVANSPEGMFWFNPFPGSDGDDNSSNNDDDSGSNGGDNGPPSKRD
jgi:serine/threonine-protein kinase